MTIPVQMSPGTDRQPGENPRQYAAFSAYLQLPAGERSINAAYRKSRRVAESRGSAPPNWRNWAERFRWAERAEAWDSHLCAVARQAEEERARELARSRFDFEFRYQKRIEALIEKMLAYSDKLFNLPPTTVKKITTTEATNDKPAAKDVTSVQGMRPSELARFLDQINVLASTAVNGHVRKSLTGRLPDAETIQEQAASGAVRVEFVEGENEDGS